MSLKSEIILEWGDGEFLFALKGTQIEELENICGKVGFAAIYQRIQLGMWKWGDLYHVIRLGLIGGGMGAVEAKRKVDMYINVPLAAGPNNPESVAKAVLGAVFMGFEDIPTPGENQAGV